MSSRECHLKNNNVLSSCLCWAFAGSTRVGGRHPAAPRGLLTAVDSLAADHGL